MLSHHSRNSDYPSPTAYMSHPGSVTPSLPNNPLLKCTRGIGIALVMFTGFLVFPISSSAFRCYISTTKAYDDCKEKTHTYADGRQFQSIDTQEEILTFNAAKDLCEELKMNISTPWSPEENEDVRKISIGNANCWIGISDKQEEGNWIYVSGRRKGHTIWNGGPKSSGPNGQQENKYYTEWKKGEPDNNPQKNNALINKGTWEAADESKTISCVICETRKCIIFKDCTPTATLTPTYSVTPTKPSINQCSEVTNSSQPLSVTVADLFANGVVFEFTISRQLVSDDGVVEALLWGVENATASLVAKCNITTLSRHTCKFPPPPASLPTENVSGIYIRYIPSPSTICPLGFAMVVRPQMRLVSNMSGASAPVCPVMANAVMDGSVFVLVARSPCAPKESQQGAVVASHITAPFSVFGPSAAVFGNIDLTVFPCVVAFGIVYLGKRAGWTVTADHPILKYKVGFRATLFGMWLWLAEITYPGVLVGTFELMREGHNIDIIFGAVGCVYLVFVPVMVVVAMGPFRSPLVTYANVKSSDGSASQCMCSSQFTPDGMWGGTGPALGPVTQPFAGIRKAAWCAPLPYIVMAVVGAVLHGIGPGTSCVARLASVSAFLFVVGVAIAATRPFRYNINNVLYTVSFNLLAMYTALLTITASRHDVGHRKQEDSSDTAMGFARLLIGVSLCLVFLVRGGVFVVIVIKGGSIGRMRTLR